MAIQSRSVSIYHINSIKIHSITNELIAYRIYLDPWRKNKESYTFCDGGCQALTDTNSNEIIGPDEMIDTIHDSILAFYNNNTDQYLVNRKNLSN